MVEPDKLATWANAITVGRLLLSPLMFWVIPNDEFGSWIAFTMWIVFSSTDFLDGYLARRQGTTSAGAFLDPLADKVLILGAMFTLVSTGVFWVVPVVIITAREVVISVYRVLVGGKGISVPAIRTGEVQDRVSATCGGLRAVAAHGRRRHLVVERLPVARRGARVGEWRPVPPACPPARSGRAGVDGRSGRASGNRRMTLRCDVLAVGTELLLGQIIDSNSAWIGGELAANGIDSLVQVKVGDNVGRIELQLRRLLDSADAVIMCGGLGPTHDDLTRDAIAAVMGVELVTDDAVADVIGPCSSPVDVGWRRTICARRWCRSAPRDPARRVVRRRGLICPVTVNGVRQGHLRGAGRAARDVGHGDRAILPDLRRRSGDGPGDRQPGAAHVG